MPGLRVNSYSIFGPNYYGACAMIVRAHHALYGEGWQLRIHHDHHIDSAHYGRVLKVLQAEGLVKLLHVPGPTWKCLGMLWRMLPLWDYEVEYSFCRDGDSLLTPRERKIVEHFIQSGMSALGVNDIGQHSVELMGGMTGFRCIRFREMTGFGTWQQFLKACGHSGDAGWWGTHGSDQLALARVVLPAVRSELVCYRPFPGARAYPGTKTILEVPDIQLPDTEITRYVDRLCTCIGACGFVGPESPNFHFVTDLGCQNVFEFFDRFGNQSVNEVVRRAEAAADWRY